MTPTSRIHAWVLSLTMMFLTSLALSFGSHAFAQDSGNASAEQDQSQSEEALTSEQTDALDALLTVLQDEQTREALIERLNAAQFSEPLTAPDETEEPVQGEGTEPAVGGDAPEPDAIDQLIETNVGLAARSAQNVQDFAVQFYNGILRFGRDLLGMRYAFEGMTSESAAKLAQSAGALFGTIIVILAILGAGYWLLSQLNRKLLGEDKTVPEARGVLYLTILSLAEIALVIVTWVGGYLAAEVLFSDGEISREQTALLNAVLVAGVARVILTLLAHPERREITILRFAPSLAGLIYRRLQNIADLTIFGLLFVVPVASFWANFATGRALRVIIVTMAAVWALASVHQISRLIKEAPDTDDDAETKHAEGFWSRIGPIAVIVLTATAWVISIAQPQFVVPYLGYAVGQVLVVGVSATIIVRLLSALGHANISMPRSLDEHLPDLQPRVARLLPYVTRGLSFVIAIIAAVLMLDALTFVDAFGLWMDPSVRAVIANVVGAAMIVLGASIVWLLVASLIDAQLTKKLKSKPSDARRKTLLALFRNAFTVILLVFTAMTALSKLGLDIAPLLAGAGVVGLAIGFGAQKLVQDVITGIFIQLENAFNVGDVVTVGGISGSVEHLTIRSVGLRDINGTFHIVPFSAVDNVSNFTRDFAYHVSVVGIGYGEDTDKAKTAMQEAFKRLKATDLGKDIIGELEMHGVVELGDSSVNIRARIKTKPGNQWGIGRKFTELVKTVFDEECIEIPYPHRTLLLSSPDSQSIVMPKDKPKSEDQPQAKTVTAKPAAKRSTAAKPAAKKPIRRTRKPKSSPPSDDEAESDGH